MNGHPYRTAYGVTIAALRDDTDGIRLLLHDLPREELAAVAEGALLAMAGAVREALHPDDVADMIRAVQHLSLTEQENQA
ncbi:hypothetical protein [Streptomyces sp. DH37]|uniref:hypothetical protein n=1 Tax=Streptomyces sp. DH37 TaxID=3040122 RepID=UPI0024417382|nr:hypothetical protein [Streptomyces sp. DH37]MDG9706263.1 hypothetical protein [Streptomyces sp. DH37]